MIDSELQILAASVLDACRTRKLKLATAESCTGGLVSAALTAIAGSSDVFDRGFVTYSNTAKREMLGVPSELLVRYGAVSRECALAMAEGALANSLATIACSITGIAGPGGGSPEKPVGLVYLACAARGLATTHQRLLLLDHDRTEIRYASALTALRMIENQARVAPALG